MSLYRGPSIIGESADNTVAMVLSAISSATNAANAAAAANTSEVNAQSSEEAAAASALALATYEGLTSADSAAAEASKVIAVDAALAALNSAADAEGSASSAAASENTAATKAAEVVAIASNISLVQSAVTAATLGGATATSQAALATTAKVAAEAARDAAMVTGKVYASTAAGLAATTTTQYFSVPVIGSTDSLILYLNSAGTAVEQNRYPSSAAIPARVFDTLALAKVSGITYAHTAYVISDETKAKRAVQYLVIGGVFRLIAVLPPLDVSTLFTPGIQGGAWDLSDPAHLQNTIAGTGAVAAEGDQVGRVTDLSGRGHHLVAAANDNRPLYRTRGGGGIRVNGGSNVMWLETVNAIDLSGSTKVTIVASHQVRRDEDTTIMLEFSANATSNAGTFNFTKVFQTSLHATAATATTRSLQPAYLARRSQHAETYAAVLDIQGAAAADRFKIIRLDGVDTPLGSESGTWANAGPITFGSHKLYLGARATGLFPLTGDIFRALVISRELTAGELTAAIAWVNESLPVVPALNAAVIGDSTIAGYANQLDVAYFIADLAAHQIALAGNSIAQQQTRWNAATVDKTSLDAVIVQIGLNDLSGAETAATVIARLQAFIDDINSDTAAPIIIGQMTPCRTARPDYAKWLAVNEAIAGLGATPVTGVEQRVTSHVAQLDNGSGYLLPQYDTGDGIHHNNASRQIVAAAWRVALIAQGLL